MLGLIAGRWRLTVESHEAGDARACPESSRLATGASFPARPGAGKTGRDEDRLQAKLGRESGTSVVIPPPRPQPSFSVFPKPSRREAASAQSRAVDKLLAKHGSVRWGSPSTLRVPASRPGTTSITRRRDVLGRESVQEGRRAADQDGAAPRMQYISCATPRPSLECGIAGAEGSCAPFRGRGARFTLNLKCTCTGFRSRSGIVSLSFQATPMTRSHPPSSRSARLLPPAVRPLPFVRAVSFPVASALFQR
jgi:hypothetical protein